MEKKDTAENILNTKFDNISQSDCNARLLHRPSAPQFTYGPG